jgi:diaminopimelate epimerase
MRFTKMHGAGNDYLYVDGRVQERNWPALSAAMSDRHTGVGSDGLIVLMPSDAAELRMAMFNADGSEGKMCGNGIRCLVAFAMDRGMVPKDRERVHVETLSGMRWVEPVWDNGRFGAAVVGMGEPILNAEDVPVVAPGHETVLDYPLRVDGQDFRISCVSMGNPHAVAFLDRPVADVRLHEIGPVVENHPMFPEQVNFEIAQVVDDGRIEARVWERGSGLTMACGTGACAVAVVARIQSRTGDRVAVALPGGDLTITWPGSGEVVMEGPVATVFEGEWPD